MTDNRTTELLPCPICGKKVYIGLYDDGRDYWWMVHGGMHYDECHCRLFMESCKFELEDETRADYDEHAMGVRGGLARRWNQRHVETCEPVETEAITYYDEYGHDAVKVHFMECDRCGGTYEHVNGAYERCPRCGKAVG